MTLRTIGRVAISQEEEAEPKPLLDPYLQDDSALISAAEDFTVSINTISDQLYKRYRDVYKAGQYDNDYFVLMSQMGLGDQEKPILKVHYLNHINNIDQIITSTWAENVAVVEDFQKDKKSERLYLAFSSFCQSLGSSPLEKVLDTFKSVSHEVGGIFPGLIPYTRFGSAAVEGVNYLINTILDAQYKSQVKTVEFCFYPADQNQSPNIGEAPLQTGAYAFFFEEVNLEPLRMQQDGTLISMNNETVMPYIVVNIKKGITLAPGQIERQLATEVIETFHQSYGNSLSAINNPQGYFESLEELGSQMRLSSVIKRYFELKNKAIGLSESEEKRLTILSNYLQSKLPGF